MEHTHCDQLSGKHKEEVWSEGGERERERDESMEEGLMEGEI